jgi:hypothetical protein
MQWEFGLRYGINLQKIIITHKLREEVTKGIEGFVFFIYSYFFANI